MPDLSRCLSAFAKTPVLGWNGSAWVDTGLRGRLQVYDRFITERDFGQRKRILTLSGNPAMPAQKVLKLQGSDTVYLLESAVEDMAESSVYATTWALHEAAFPVQVCKKTEVVSQSGVKLAGAEQVLLTTWVDITRYSSVDSKEFANTDYTIYTLFFAPGTVLDTDMYVRRVDNGLTLEINEVFQALELPAARCQGRG